MTSVESRQLSPSGRRSRFRAPWAVTRGAAPDLLFWAVTVYMLVAVAEINALYRFLLPLRLATVSLVASCGLYAISARGARSVRSVFRQRPSRLIVLLFVWAVFTVPFSLYPGLAFQTVELGFSQAVLLFLLIVGTMRDEADLERFAFFYFVGTVLYATYAVRHMDALLENSWRLTHIANASYDSNDFAVFCVTGMPLAIHFIRQSGKRLRRVVGVVGLPLLATGIVVSGSRGGFLSMLAVGVFLLVRYRAIRWQWRVAGVALAAVVVLATATGRYWEQMNTIIHPSQDYNVTASSGRLDLWKRGLGYTAEFPLTGVGVNNFGIAEGTISQHNRELQESGVGVPWNTAHNTYVQILAELGVPGGVLFFLLLFQTWRSMGRAERATASPHLQSLVQGIKGSAIGMFVGIVFLSHAYSYMTYAVLALGTAAGKVLAQQQRAPRRVRGARRAGRSKAPVLASALSRTATADDTGPDQSDSESRPVKGGAPS